MPAELTESYSLPIINLSEPQCGLSLLFTQTRVDRAVVFITPLCRCEIWMLYRKYIQQLKEDAPEEFLALL